MKRAFFLFFAIVFILSACGSPGATPTAVITSEGTAAVNSPSPTATATPQPAAVLTVCTSSLPDNLFPYDGSQTPIEDDILAMLQETPFEWVEDEQQPVLLQNVPTFENGGMRLEPITVQGGQTVVDARGEVVVMKAGVSYRPPGCRQADCAVTWDGQSPVEMDQMVIDFEFKEGLTWSDGHPLTAADSVFSFTLASDPGALGLKWAEERTASYAASSGQTVQWVGRPGFTTADIMNVFWQPLPLYLFEGVDDWSQISQSPIFTDMLPSYGPFILSSVDGNTLQLDANPAYLRTDQGLPYLDSVIIKAVDGGPEAAWQAVRSGACSMLDGSFNLAHFPDLIKDMLVENSVSVQFESENSWTQLVFGIQPASYDDGYTPAYGDRPDFFGDPLTRQAVAACLDRDSMLAKTLDRFGEVWFSFLPPGKSKLDSDAHIAYKPEVAAQRLFDAGWRDHDNNQDTPLQAWNVSNVPPGTMFSIQLLIDQSGFQRDLAEIIQRNLKNCSIEVTIASLPADELYAPGPEGPVFGRSFDLVLLTWQPMPELDCSLYQSWQTPLAENQWIGTNAAGFSEDGYDDACSTANLALPDELRAAVQKAERTYSTDLPSVPLFSGSGVMVIPAAGCNQQEPATEIDFFNVLEFYKVSGPCP